MLKFHCQHLNVSFILFTLATLGGKEHDSIEFYKSNHAKFPINNSDYALHVFASITNSNSKFSYNNFRGDPIYFWASWPKINPQFFFFFSSLFF